METNYVALLEELASCKLNSCDKDGICDYQKQQRALLEKNYIAAANQIVKYGYTTLGSGEWTEENAKIYVESHLKFMSESMNLTPEQQRIFPAPKMPMSQICADMRKEMRNLEAKVS